MSSQEQTQEQKETEEKQEEQQEPEVSDKIFTVPNVISFIRLCCIPLFFVLLLTGYDIPATIVFALAAGTDFLDGQIARRTNSVSKLGQLLDPTVDRLLMIFGVIGLLCVHRLPLWIVVVVIVRDLFLLLGGAYLLTAYRIRIPVIYPGKFATTFLFVGFVGLLLNWPMIPGLGLVGFTWLPGLNAAACSWGIWFVYAGLILSIGTAIYYTWAGIKALMKARSEQGRPEGDAQAQ